MRAMVTASKPNSVRPSIIVRSLGAATRAGEVDEED